MISTATDNDTREDTSSKKSFCAFVEVDGERRAKMQAADEYEDLSRLPSKDWKMKGFRGRCAKRHRRQLDEAYDSREYQQSPPTTHTQKISVSTTTSTGTNIASA